LRIAVSSVDAARWLLAGVMVALLVSPPLTVAFELSLYALMLGSAQCRARLWRAAREPLGAMALAFWLLVALGMLYSIAPWEERLAIWFGWRRLLLLIFGLALFEEIAWKRRLVWLLVAIAAAGASASYLGAFLDVAFRYNPAGIVFRNHTIQGMVFGLAAFAALLLLREREAHTGGQRIFLAVLAIALVFNAVFITTARSGYAVMVVLAVLLAYSWPRTASRLRRLALTAGALAVVAAVLASSPIVQLRVVRGLGEIRTYERATEESAMGVRVIFLRHALELAMERPLFGYGTGAFRAAYATKVERHEIQSSDPHNAYVNVTVQHGLIGLALFLALLGSALRHRASPPYRLLGLGALAAWCVSSLFSGHFSTFAEGRFIWLWLGACLAREGPA
jgi:O-antigen ligase